MDQGRSGEAQRLHEIDSRLAQQFGRPAWRSHGPPLDELISTILSQHTSDTNTARAFAALRSRFPTWPDVLDAAESDVADTIRSGGLANLKAPRIQNVLRAVAAETGEISLNWIQTWPMETARSWLQSLPGVGPKTAACVLLFSLGMPAMPVDTHVHRVTRRLGLIPDSLDANRAHPALDHLIGPNRDAIYALHLNLIQHGRSTCKARAPTCCRCALNDLCPSASLMGRDERPMPARADQRRSRKRD